MAVKQVYFNQYTNPNYCEMGIYKDDGIIVPNFIQLTNCVRIRSEFRCEE